jgi:hypothetical protein
MNIKNGLMALGAVVVGGIIVAGQTLGWSSFLPTFSSAQISIIPASRPPSEAFFADEKVWVTLSQTETDRVYWVFDESTNVISSGIQLQYTFPFDASAPIGGESRRRIDAFYKVGDDYRHAVKRVSVRNIQIKVNASFGAMGLAYTLPTELLGDWKLGTVRLVRLSQGQFHNLAIQPKSSTATSTVARIVWDGAEIASEFGYTSSEEAGMKLVANRTAWVSAEYKGQKTGETLTVVKPLGMGGKP